MRDLERILHKYPPKIHHYLIVMLMLQIKGYSGMSLNYSEIKYITRKMANLR